MFFFLDRSFNRILFFELAKKQEAILFTLNLSKAISS